MSEPINNGGSAFPGPMDSGISVRDYFAAKVLQAWVSAGAFSEEAAKMFSKQGITEANDVEDLLSKIAYDQADSMSRHRSKVI